MATIRTTDGWTYKLSSGDVMWLARAADSEGGEPDDVIWAYLQRLALPNFRNRTMSWLVQNHAQSINPAWLEDGAFCRPGGAAASLDSCASALLRRRATNRAKGWPDLKPATQQAITRLLEGRLPNRIPRAVDFATRSVSEAFIGRNPGAFILLCRGNCFIVTRESTPWPDDFVRVTPDSAKDLLVPALIGAAGVAGLGLLVWGLYRFSR